MGKGEGLAEEHTKPYNQEDFEVELCECFNNPGICLLTCCSCGPCVTNYLTAEKINESGIVYCLLSIGPWWPVGTSLMRIKVREYYGIPDNTAMDVLLGICCACCSTCQMNNEAELRGPVGQPTQ